MKNKTPAIPIENNFKLSATETIVSYLFKGKTHYFKIENIEDNSATRMP